MADIKQLKVGADYPEALLFDNFKVPVANQNILFDSIVPKNNTWTHQQNGEWEINDGWDVTFINSRTIRIDKFKIDTWGIRHKITTDDDEENYYDYEQMAIRVYGLDYVHKNIIKATSNSEEVTGFVPAYFGTTGWLVAWRPGQFTSGKYLQGLVLQGCGDYIESYNLYGDLSFAVGRDPNGIVDSREHFVTDGIRPLGAPHGNYPRAFCIGLFGGVQESDSNYDESKGAYKEYDISDTPIYLYLDVPDYTAPVDVSTVECWDAYLNATKVYHKDKTVESCWKKYGMLTEKGSYYNMDMANIPSEVTNPILPEVIDYEQHILPKVSSNIKPIKWRHKIANTEFWDNIKNYLTSHPVIFVEDAYIEKGAVNHSDYTSQDNNKIDTDWFRGADMSGDLTIKFDGCFGNAILQNCFNGNNLNTLTLQFLQDNLIISAAQHMLRALTIGTFKVVDKNGNPSNTFIGARDCSAMCEWTVIKIFPDVIDWTFRREVDGVKNVPIQYMFSYCSSLTEVAQHGTERYSIDNTILCGGTAQAFQGCTSLTKIGPVLNLSQNNFAQNPGIDFYGYKMFEDCNALTDVRIKLLNGSYVNFDDNSQHGTLPNLNEESIQYLFDNLKDLTTYDEEIAVSSTSNNFLNKTSEIYDWNINENKFATDIKNEKIVRHRNISYVINGRRVESATASTEDDCFIFTTYAVNCDITVSGLQDNDILYWYNNGEKTQLINGNNHIEGNVGIKKGFILAKNGVYQTLDDFEHKVTITLKKYYQPDAAKAPSAQLHCPEEWESKITTEMIAAAKAKNWTIYINNVIKEN